ncbi:hypothetical protein KRR23_05505 [Pseudomonas sp. CVAP|uniref:hypothetical protein n=1 Tax=Pseudomonas sp. CVAP\|nr:hypothetical protein [Pseudomonas sp. CVAP\
MSELPSDFREKAFQSLADNKEKALCALIRALLDKGADINALIDMAEADLRENFNEGHAITVLNDLKTAYGLVKGVFRKTDPALDDPSKKDVKEWPRR